MNADREIVAQPSTGLGRTRLQTQRAATAPSTAGGPAFLGGLQEAVNQRDIRINTGQVQMRPLRAAPAREGSVMGVMREAFRRRRARISPDQEIAAQPSTGLGRTRLQTRQRSEEAAAPSARPTKRTRMTPDREIAGQASTGLGRTRLQTQQQTEPREEETVEYWVGKPQPKKPRKKPNETETAFKKRNEDYQLFIELWKQGNQRTQPRRAAKRN